MLFSTSQCTYQPSITFYNATYMLSQIISCIFYLITSLFSLNYIRSFHFISFMENLYTSFCDDITSSNIADTNDIAIYIIRTINGHTNLDSLANYYSIDEYNQNAHILSPATKPCLNIAHINIRSLQKNSDNLTSLLDHI